MFRKLLALVVVLCLGAAAVAAPPTIAIDEGSIVFNSTGEDFPAGTPYATLEFNVILTGLGSGPDGMPTTGEELHDWPIGIDIGVLVSGSGAGHVVGILGPMPAVFNQKTGSEWDAEIAASGGVYMFPNIGVDSTSKLDGQLLSNSILDPEARYDANWKPAGFIGASPDVGDVVARFILLWDEVEPTLGDEVILHLQGSAAITPQAFFIMNDVSISLQSEGDVAISAPEPATMGLLGLGLVGLVIRRKK